MSDPNSAAPASQQTLGQCQDISSGQTIVPAPKRTATITPASSPAQRLCDVLPVHPAAELLPRPTAEEQTALVEDIRTNGLLHPIVVTGENNAIIDGLSRGEALRTLGIEIGPEHVVKVNVGDPLAYVLAVNVHRRHLTPEQRRELIAKLLKTAPEKSNLAIAKLARADDKTVGAVRAKLEARSEIPNVERRTDTKGRKQPKKKPCRTEDDFKRNIAARRATTVGAPNVVDVRRNTDAPTDVEINELRRLVIEYLDMLIEVAQKHPDKIRDSDKFGKMLQVKGAAFIRLAERKAPLSLPSWE